MFEPARLFLAAAVSVVSLLVGCAADPALEGDDESSEASGDQGEEEVALTEQAASASCSIDGEKGKLYTFAGCDYTVCWVHVGGPFGVADNRYTLRNNSFSRRKVRIALERLDDLHCQYVSGQSTISWQSDGIKFAGKPQTVKRCR